MHSYLITATALLSLFSRSLAQIDPNSVPLSDRRFWCSSQQTQCPLICTQVNDGSAAVLSNSCDAPSLSYSCVCGNGVTPNASEYSQTVPYFICTETNTQCVKNCGMNNNACAAACTQNNPCGAQDPKRVNTTDAPVTTTTTAGPMSSSTGSDGGAVYNGFGGSSSTQSSNSGTTGSGAVRLLASAERYSLGVVATGIFAGFALFL